MTRGGSQWRRSTGRTSASRGGPSRTSRRPLSTRNEIYDDLLDEALQQVPPDENRPLKKRKSQRDSSQVIVVDDASSGVEEISPKKARDIVEVESSESEPQQTDDEDEMDWDDVDLAALPTSEDTAAEIVPAVREVTLTTTTQKPPKKRTTAISRTAILKRIRVEAHKMHLLSLLASFRNLNLLLSSPSLLKILRPLIPPATVNALNTGPEHTQARRTIAFLSGLRDVVSLWSEQWKETRKGWRRPRWVDPEDLGKIPAYLDMNESISSDGLIQSVISRSGSRDVGAWLFTALLRSVGVETRLVCSLQPLQFGFVNEGPRQEFHPEIQPTTEQSVTEMTRENSHISISSTDTPSEAPASRTVSKRKPAFPSSSLRQTGTYRSPAEYLAQTKTYSPNHPFFWSEAWDVASQKWITVEPMVGAKVNQPSRIEPPGTAAAWESGAMGDNILNYAIALDNSGFAKDVTKRYSKAYYSKTWRNRIESQGGEKWWTRVIKYLDRMEPLDRDQLEDIDLANHLLKEPVPKKIDDFRYHPLYVLERHLRRNEMLTPAAVHVSALTSGKGMNLKTENVYKRKDVISCFTAREWFRRGRIIKEGQQPVKYTSTSNRKRGISVGEEEEGDTESATPLYSEMQTEIYVPPPVENGIVPKNTYGNIDVYTPSMVPAGGAHIVRPSISLAAQFAGIDYADAVTGFDFVKNKASARVNGIVVASENVEGLLTIWEGMMERVTDEEERRRVIGVLERWRRFFVRLGIRRRLDETHGKIDGSDETMPQEEHAEEEDKGDLGGGFLLGAVQDGQGFARESHAQAARSSGYELYDGGDGFTLSKPASPGEHKRRSGSVAISAMEERAIPPLVGRKGADQVSAIERALGRDEEDAQKTLEKMEDGGSVEYESEGGGFLPDADNDSEGGGFIYEDEDGIL